MKLDTNYTKQFLEAFIDDSLFNAENKTYFKGKVVKYEIYKSKPFSGYINGDVFIETTKQVSPKITKPTITKVDCGFLLTDTMRAKFKDELTLKIIYLNSTVNSELPKENLKTALYEIYRLDIVTLSHIEKYIVKIINEKGYYPSK